MTEPSTTDSQVEVMTYSEADHLPVARAFAHTHAHRLGLTADQAASLALAVSELVTNTLQHTSGGGAVRMWAEDGRVICDVIDSGPMRAFDREMPAADAVRGRGLAIVERLCDQVGAIAGPDGTTVRLEFAVERRAAAS